MIQTLKFWGRYEQSLLADGRPDGAAPAVLSEESRQAARG